VFVYVVIKITVRWAKVKLSFILKKILHLIFARKKINFGKTSMGVGSGGQRAVAPPMDFQTWYKYSR